MIGAPKCVSGQLLHAWQVEGSEDDADAGAGVVISGGVVISVTFVKLVTFVMGGVAAGAAAGAGVDSVVAAGVVVRGVPGFPKNPCLQLQLSSWRLPSGDTALSGHLTHEMFAAGSP